MRSANPSDAAPPAPTRAARVPVALTIAGSDSGGGAGIQADLRAFAHFRVFGVTAITAVTAQNPHAVTAVHAIPAAVVAAQLAAVFADFDIRAVKTGMLFDAEIVAGVAAALDALPGLPLVVDPVMVATSGAKLLRDDAIDALCTRLLPRATVITPNIPETRLLLGAAIRNRTDIERAARTLAQRFGNLVVVKGGHADTDANTAGDVVSDGTRTWLLASRRVAAPTTHGTGCSFSAALAACLARGDEWIDALRQAKAYVLEALDGCIRVGPETWAMHPADQATTAEIEWHELPVIGQE